MAKKDKKSEVTYRIDKIYGTIDNGNKVYLKISWNDGPARDELRKCWFDKDGNMKIGKGLEITDLDIDELHALKNQKPKPVNFDDVFEQSMGVMEKRAKGFKTEDGFIVLTRRPGAKI